MLGWAVGFFIAAIVAAVFGFGGIASAFAGIAIIMFWVFVALAVLSLLFGAFGGSHAARHSGSGNVFAAIAVVCVIALGVYAWNDNNMSAERLGAEIDETAVQLAESTSEALGDASDRAENLVDDTADEVREDTSDGLQEASNNVDPDRSETP